jgi:hypothetical protein
VLSSYIPQHKATRSHEAKAQNTHTKLRREQCEGSGTGAERKRKSRSGLETGDRGIAISNPQPPPPNPNSQTLATCLDVYIINTGDGCQVATETARYRNRNPDTRHTSQATAQAQRATSQEPARQSATASNGQRSSQRPQPAAQWLVAYTRHSALLGYERRLAPGNRRPPSELSGKPNRAAAATPPQRRQACANDAVPQISKQNSRVAPHRRSSNPKQERIRFLG